MFHFQQNTIKLFLVCYYNESTSAPSNPMTPPTRWRLPVTSTCMCVASLRLVGKVGEGGGDRVWEEGRACLPPVAQWSAWAMQSKATVFVVPVLVPRPAWPMDWALVTVGDVKECGGSPSWSSTHALSLALVLLSCSEKLVIKLSWSFDEREGKQL